MLGKLRKLFANPTPAQRPSLPHRERVYAIGDIHGRLDLFEKLLETIAHDEATRGPAQTTLVLLGDLIDRGQDSAGVLARARQLTKERHVEILCGNHEEMLLTSLEDSKALRSFLRFGGLETLVSYGLAAESIAEMEIDELRDAARRAIPEQDLEFIRSFRKLVRIGDYIFVHAGLRPGVSIETQLGSDCRWIREPFLSHTGNFGGFVVHGHTITEEPDERDNRLGIDTGAYVHGTLTAVGIEGTERWYLTAEDGTHENHPIGATVAA
ncbi:metallophosphoesterase [Novosphingobium profundi]|uniref:metallophosphoesterase n=1 Tax=Novosphingobium profundi TaxID=1774954 RepID=UPI001CFD60DB|nr:metallophosphoesterase [Novosphingobium profundi]